MIKLYSGTPGSGKSLHLARRIYYTLKSGRPVIANFEIDLSKINRKHPERLRFRYFPNRAGAGETQLSPANLIAFSREYFGKKRVKEEHIFLVIDECQIIFNSRSWQHEGRAEWLTFFSQHRKYGYEIILVAQFDGMVDKQIRSLIEYDYKHRKISNFGLAGKIFGALFLGRLFCAVCYWYPINERLSAEWFLASSRYYRIYDTYRQFDNSDATPPAIPEKKNQVG